MFYIVGLGNPEEEYKDTRHNTGQIMLDYAVKKFDMPEWKHDKKTNSLMTKGEIESSTIKKLSDTAVFLKPQTFMNLSGKSVAPVINSLTQKATLKKAESLIVVHDDLDLPLGTVKIAFNRGSGGHRGIESIKKAIKTEAFIRIKVGISPHTPSGKTKKPSGEKVVDFIIGKFKKPELDELKKVSKTVLEAIELIVTEGRVKAMEVINQR